MMLHLLLRPCLMVPRGTMYFCANNSCAPMSGDNSVKLQQLLANSSGSKKNSLLDLLCLTISSKFPSDLAKSFLSSSDLSAKGWGVSPLVTKHPDVPLSM